MKRFTLASNQVPQPFTGEFGMKNDKGGSTAATIVDIARVAKVSVATVSRALNGSSSVTQATRDQVLSVAKQLHYVPSSAARTLITRRTHTIGTVLPDLHGEFFSELIRGIDSAARSRGLHMLVSSSHGDAAEAAAAIKAMYGRVDGLLIMSPHVNAKFLSDNLPRGVPTVLMNSRVEGPEHASFTVDNYSGALAMMRHLVGRGHRRIAFIAGPENNFDAQERLSGYPDALARLQSDSTEPVL